MQPAPVLSLVRRPRQPAPEHPHGCSFCGAENEDLVVAGERAGAPRICASCAAGVLGLVAGFGASQVSVRVEPRVPMVKALGVDIASIQHAVALRFGVRASDLLAADRRKTIALARHVAMYVCRRQSRCSLSEIAEAFGNRDHTTVVSAIQKVERLRLTDPQVAEVLADFEPAVPAPPASGERAIADTSAAA